MAVRLAKSLLTAAALLITLGSVAATEILFRPGDYKQGYERADYQTRTLSLGERKGKPADLLGMVSNPSLGLPPVPVPADNPVTAEKVWLGRKLFYDRRLSLNNTISCAMCHVPEQGFTNNEMATAVGVEGRTVKRNAPTSYNVAYFTRLFHDGREDTLEQQVWAPLLARNEMANPSIGVVINKIKGMKDYDGLFEKAFARGPTMETVGMALASYQRALISGNSPFDRWYYGKQGDAISVSAKRGFGLFTGKGGCVACHHIGDAYALYTDNELHNTGLGWYASLGNKPKTRKVQLAPGVFVDVETAIIESVGELLPNDLGLYEVTQNPADRWRYKTPSLRNVVLTAPYMHNGSLATLEEVVAFYNQGGYAHELLDPLIRPLALTEQEMSDLVAFLKTLTGDNIGILVADAFAAPIGDLRERDPHWAHGKDR